MGQMTRANIVKTGIVRAGNASLTASANGWLNQALQHLYDSWPWPFLQQSVQALSLPQGTGLAGVLLGAGQGGVAQQIRRVLDPVFIYTSDYRTQARVRVKELVGGTALDNPVVNDPAKNIGQAQMFYVRESTSVNGQWVLIPFPFPDQAYLLNVEVIVRPAFLDETVGGSDDGTTPIYPGDATMIKAVEVEALRYMSAGDPRYLARLQAEEGNLASLAAADKLRYGVSKGTNDSMGLDEDVFLSESSRQLWWTR